MSRVALLWGLNYAGTPAELRGCANDVAAVAALLTGAGGFDEVHAFDDAADRESCTGAGIMRRLQALSYRSWKQHIAHAWIHYSGHGTRLPDDDGDEADGADECICPVDCREHGVIPDDFLSGVLRSFNPATRVTCVFDCCHSGTVCDLPWAYSAGDGGMHRNPRAPHCPARVLCVSGCMDSQASADAWNVRGRRQFTGAMTSTLLLCLQEEPALAEDARRLVDAVRARLRARGFPQRPQLTCSQDLEDRADDGRAVFLQLEPSPVGE